MKYTLFLIYYLGMGTILFAQTVEEKVAAEVCVCLGELVEKEEVEGEINKCLPKALAKVLDNGTETEKNSLATVGDVQRAMLRAKDLLTERCAVVRKGVLQNKKNTYYTQSSSQKANDFYSEGVEKIASGSYFKAIKKLKKAIKADKEFVMALDELGIAYGNIQNYEEAISWFRHSLAVFPEGDLALLKIAEAYFLMDDPDNSLRYYRKLNDYYPENPEGFLGIAKVFLLTGDYDSSLENILPAHRVFLLQGREKSRESQEIIETLYKKFNELNKSEAFFSKTEKCGFKLSMIEK